MHGVARLVAQMDDTPGVVRGKLRSHHDNNECSTVVSRQWLLTLSTSPVFHSQELMKSLSRVFTPELDSPHVTNLHGQITITQF
jgi:hypothetical protein